MIRPSTLILLMASLIILPAQADDSLLERARREAADRLRMLTERTRSYIEPKIQAMNCRRNMALLASPFLAAGITYGYYNWGYPDGHWETVGDPEFFPNFIPEVGSEFQVDERISTFTLPARRTLWVHNGKFGFGKVFVERDMLEYRRGNTVVAKTGVISPFGRPYDRSIPIRVPITDAGNKPIGMVEEVSEEISPGIHQFHFQILDAQGRIVGKTSALKESSLSKPLQPVWKMSLQDGNNADWGELNRTSHLVSKSYHWKLNLQPEKSIDPRLLVILSTYKSYVESFRD